MKKQVTLCFLTVFLALSMLHLAAADVTVGGDSGSVTLTNPDDSSFTYDNSNQTTFSYLSNAPDGWWNIDITVDEELWVIGLVFGIIALAIAVVALVYRREKE